VLRDGLDPEDRMIDRRGELAEEAVDGAALLGPVVRDDPVTLRSVDLDRPASLSR
jgi:hypothetical protein